MAEHTLITEDDWRTGVASFVLEQTGGSDRVLEVGCGDGWLTEALAEAGHDVLGIDPKAPEGANLQSVGLGDLETTDRFDHVVAVLSLHHIHDLAAALEKIGRLLAAPGRLVLVEFGWDRFDDKTMEWCRDRLPPVPPDDEGTWLQRACLGWAETSAADEHATAEDHFHRWADDEGLHGSAEMLEELGSRFRVERFEWAPYLYPELDEATSEQTERDAIAAGAINAIGFRFVGRWANALETKGSGAAPL